MTYRITNFKAPATSMHCTPTNQPLPPPFQVQALLPLSPSSLARAPPARTDLSAISVGLRAGALSHPCAHPTVTCALYPFAPAPTTCPMNTTRIVLRAHFYPASVASKKRIRPSTSTPSRSPSPGIHPPFLGPLAHSCSGSAHRPSLSNACLPRTLNPIAHRLGRGLFTPYAEYVLAPALP